MTPAEFILLLQSCGLGQTQAAALFGVRDRTVRYWVAGRLKVPVPVATELTRLDELLDHVAGQALAALIPTKAGTGAPQAVHLLIYPDDDALAKYRPAEAKRLRFASVHRALVDRLRRRLEAAGAAVRVVTLDQAAYSAWRRREKHPDGEATRAAWAGLQIGG